MHTRKTLMTQLKDIGINPAGTLMVHLSYKSIGEVDGRGDAVLDALMTYMEPGHLVLPAHTWKHVGKEISVMDVLNTPSCVGVLTNMFRNRPGVVRSLHPTHSLAACGADAKAFVAGEENIITPCGKDGAYYRLWERNAQILLIGVNFTCNTYIHGIEEWDGAKGTISPVKTDLYVINYERQRCYTPQYRHCAPLGSDTFSKLEGPALKNRIVRMERFGDADVRVMQAKPLRAMAAEILKEDPSYLLRY